MENASKKRRSFVDVRRKSLVFDKIFNEDDGANSKNDVPNITMNDYVASLKRERLQWKEVMKAKGKRLRECKDSCNYKTLELTAKDVEPFMNDEDKAFLKDGPNYLKMMEDVDRYLETVNFLKRYKSDVMEYYENAVEEISIITNTLIKRLCHSDACELCNQMNCSNVHHEFPAVS